jgi:iron complex transport system substrate-binding protein
MRVLSLHPVATELVCSLGAAHLLVGRTDECDYPEAARSVPSIGKMAEITTDTIAVFEPDIVLTGPGQKIAPPDSANWTLLRVEPETLDDIYGLLTTLGATLSMQVEADMVIHDLRSAIEHVHEACARFHTTRAYCEIESGHARVPTYVRELVAVAGGDAYNGSADLEPLLAFNPQAIIVLAQCEDEHYIELVMSRDGWRAMQAVQTERLFVVDETMFRPTPRLAQGAKMLAKLLHGVNVN